LEETPPGSVALKKAVRLGCFNIMKRSGVFLCLNVTETFGKPDALPEQKEAFYESPFSF